MAPFSSISKKLACLRSLGFFPCVSALARVREGEGGVIERCVIAHFFSLCSMAFSAKKIDALVKNLDRSQLIALLGIDDVAGQVGDHESLRPVAASSVDRFTIHKDDVPFLNKIGNNCCAGAIVRRHGKASVGIPCFNQEIEEGKFCSVCSEIWTEHDANGFYIMDTEVMPFAAKFYKPARKAVLWNMPFMKDMSEFFSEQIQVVKDVLDGTDSELERDWPYHSFKEFSSEVLINSGVLHHDAARSKNPYKRDQWENDRLANYMQSMIQCWLQISAVIDTDDLTEDMKKLQKTAKKVGLASMWAVQSEHPTTPVWIGPLVPADVMLAGFRSGAKVYKTLVHNINVASDDDVIDTGEFTWGKEVDALDEWAKSVLMARRPARKAKKYVPNSQSPPRPPKSPASPSAVRRWYAAKGTSRPGAYAHKDVAESYMVDGEGTIKMFRSLAKLRTWLGSPAPRLFFERECKQDPLPDAQEQTQDEVSSQAKSILQLKAAAKPASLRILQRQFKPKSEAGEQ